MIPRHHANDRRAAFRIGLAAAAAVCLTAAALGSLAPRADAGTAAMQLPLPAFDSSEARDSETAVLSGGCFWGVQGVFQHVKGVKLVLAGYAGGKAATAQYELVSTGTTGHAESVKVVFDPRQITFGQILRIYFSVATDPTQLNQQYPDEGPQYRGEIFYMDAAQKAVAERYVAQLTAARAFRRPIVTRIDPFNGFFAAESYHQDYLQKHPDAAYIATFDLPKVAALKALFPAAYRATPVRTF